MHSHSPIVTVLLLACLFAGFVGQFLATMDFSAFNKQVAQALAEAFGETLYQQKYIYTCMRYTQGQWSKVMSGEKTLSIARLHMTPMKFWVAVWTRLAAIRARDFMCDERVDALVERPVTDRSHAA